MRGQRAWRRAEARGLSFAGVVTFPSAGDIREAVQRCPLDRLLVETDSPYLAPVPHRGRPNRPALVKPVGEDGEVAPGYLYLLMPVRLPG